MAEVRSAFETHTPEGDRMWKASEIDWRSCGEQHLSDADSLAMMPHESRFTREWRGAGFGGFVGGERLGGAGTTHQPQEHNEIVQRAAR